VARPHVRIGLAMIPLHLGPLHPFELALTLLLAFGPFVVLWAVIVVRRREDRRDRIS
jgi:hypothetical protein